jgi:DNA-binding PadR family transcriptional regulator
MSNRRLKNPLALAVLALLSKKDAHPYDIAATLKERHLDDCIRSNVGSLYTVVRQLLRAGFIAAAKTERSGHRPERTVYKITPAGRHEMMARLREMLETPAKEYPEFGAGLSLMKTLPNEEIVKLLEARSLRLALEKRAPHELVNALATQLHADSACSAVREYSLALIKAEYDFVNRLMRRMRGKPRGKQAITNSG